MAMYDEYGIPVVAWKTSCIVVASTRERAAPPGLTLGLFGGGCITKNPWPLLGPPSAWIAMNASACASLPICARVVMHGPMPLSDDRVRITVAPSPRRIAAARFATSQVNACSGYPPLVEVPTVSQALMTPLPALTNWLIELLLFRLCPGSSTITLPVSVPGPVGGSAGGAGGVAGVAGFAGVGVPAFLDDVGVGVAARVVFIGDGLDSVGIGGGADGDGTDWDDGAALDDCVLAEAGAALGTIDDLAGALFDTGVEQPATTRSAETRAAETETAATETAETETAETIGPADGGAFRDALL